MVIKSDAATPEGEATDIAEPPRMTESTAKRQKKTYGFVPSLIERGESEINGLCIIVSGCGLQPSGSSPARLMLPLNNRD